MARSGRIHLAIATGSRDLFEQFVLLPCYQRYRRLIVPQSHPLGCARDTLLRGYMYDFVSLLAPHLTRRVVDRAAAARSQAQVDTLFDRVVLPVK